MISVDFESRVDDTKPWEDEDNIDPYISVSDPINSIRNQRNPDEIVIRKPKIYLKFSYPPMNEPVCLKYHADTLFGFTRARLALFVSLGYQRIYAEDRLFKNHMIRGHSIDDLMLLSVTQIDDSDFFDVHVDS